MIELRLLRQFVAVAEELHFRRAAERLPMAQPPLSAAIRRLEDEIGATLLIRGSRQVTLTAAGAVLLEEARRVLATLESGVARTRLAASGRVGTLDLTFLSNCALLPAALRGFRLTFPEVDLRLHEASTADQVARLLDGTADVGFLRPPGTPAPQLSFERVLSQPLRLALPADHALATVATVALEDRADDGFVATPREKGAGFHDFVLDICRRAGFSPRIVQRARQMHTVKALVASGIWIAVVPENSIEPAPPGLVRMPFITGGSADGLAVDLLMAWNPRRQSATRDRFRTVVREVVGQRSGGWVPAPSRRGRAGPG